MNKIRRIFLLLFLTNLSFLYSIEFTEFSEEIIYHARSDMPFTPKMMERRQILIEHVPSMYREIKEFSKEHLGDDGVLLKLAEVVGLSSVQEKDKREFMRTLLVRERATELYGSTSMALDQWEGEVDSDILVRLIRFGHQVVRTNAIYKAEESSNSLIVANEIQKLAVEAQNLGNNKWADRLFAIEGKIRERFRQNVSNLNPLGNQVQGPLPSGIDKEDNEMRSALTAARLSEGSDSSSILSYILFLALGIFAAGLIVFIVKWWSGGS